MRLRRQTKLDLLARVPLFSECSKRELQAIALIADELDLPAGRTLIREGRRGREFFALVDGAVEVLRDGRRLRTLGDGDFFGEIALVSELPRTATVVSTTPVRLLVVSRQAFGKVLRDSPTIRLKVLRALAQRLAPETL